MKALRKKKIAEKIEIDAVQTEEEEKEQEEQENRRGCDPATAAGADVASLAGWKKTQKNQDCGWKKREKETETETETRCDADDQ